MLRKFFIFGLIGVSGVFCAGVLLTFWEQNLRDADISGWQWRSQTWAGTMTITGDVTFFPWLKLKMEPGTKVFFKKGEIKNPGGWTEFADDYIQSHRDPTGREGYGRGHFHLVARILALGTKEAPILFTSNAAVPEYADWDQIVLWKRSRLDHVEVAYAHNGINIEGSGSLIQNSVIHDSLWSCVDIFSTGNVLDHNEIYHCWHQAVGVKKAGPNLVRNNRIHDALLGVNCENGANPRIIDNHFAAAPLGGDCQEDSGNKFAERPADTAGGTYSGRLIYPALSIK